MALKKYSKFEIINLEYVPKLTLYSYCINIKIGSGNYDYREIALKPLLYFTTFLLKNTVYWNFSFDNEALNHNSG